MNMKDSQGMDTLISRFVLDSAMALDREDFDHWLDCFADDGRYVVMPRENRAQGYDLALMYCDTKPVLQDRISVLRHASKFNPHYDRHIISASLVRGMEAGIATVETNFLVVQTTLTGVSNLFCAGGYEDRIRVQDGKARLVERIVLLDSFSVPNCLAIPL